MELDARERDAVLAFFNRNPSIIFATSGNWFGMERMTISVHKSYSGSVKLKSEMQRKLGMLVKIESFVVSLERDDIILPLTLKSLVLLLVTIILRN